MAVWTPSPCVTVKVIGLAWRGDELLVAEVEESNGRVKGLRPLGGRIEFGETREEALRREFAEELGCTIELTGPWHAFENIYEHEGAMGHEFISPLTSRWATSGYTGGRQLPSRKTKGWPAARSGSPSPAFRPAWSYTQPDCCP